MAQHNEPFEMSSGDMFEFEHARVDQDTPILDRDKASHHAEPSITSSAIEVPDEHGHNITDSQATLGPLPPTTGDRRIISRNANVSFGSHAWYHMMSTMRQDRRELHATGQPNLLPINAPIGRGVRDHTQQLIHATDYDTGNPDNDCPLSLTGEVKPARTAVVDIQKLLDPHPSDSIMCPSCHHYILPGYVTFPNIYQHPTTPDFFISHTRAPDDYVSILKPLASLFKACIMKSAEKYNTYREAKDHNAQEEFTRELVREVRPALASIRVSLEQFFEYCFPQTPELRASVLAALLDPDTRHTDWISDHHP